MQVQKALASPWCRQPQSALSEGGGGGTELSGVLVMGRRAATGVVYDARGSCARCCGHSAWLQVAGAHA
jgi:hypothetical protein